MEKMKLLYKEACEDSPSFPFVRVKDIAIAEEEGNKYLCFRIENRDTVLYDAVTVEISQRDSEGKCIRTDTLPLVGLSLKPGGIYIPQYRVLLLGDCTEYAVRVLYADAGSYRYTLTSGEIVVSYLSKREDPSSLRTDKAKTQTETTERSVTLRGYRPALTALPWLTALLLVLSLACPYLFPNVDLFSFLRSLF